MLVRTYEVDLKIKQMPKSRELFAPPNIYVLCTLYYLLIIKMYFIIIYGERKIGGREKG